MVALLLGMLFAPMEWRLAQAVGQRGGGAARTSPTAMGRERRATSRAELTQEQLVELRELFDLVDSDGGGTIDADELGGLMALLGMDSDEQTVAALIEEIDEDGNGEVDFAEFVTVMAKRGGGGDYTAKELVAAFEVRAARLRRPRLADPTC